MIKDGGIDINTEKSHYCQIMKAMRQIILVIKKFYLDL